MWEQAPTFEQSGVRFPEDTPVVIPCLQKALTHFYQQDEDPNVFQSLLYFFSTILAGPPLHHSSNSRDIINAWSMFRKNLENPYGLCHGSIQAFKQVDALIELLDPIVTILEVQQSARTYLRGSAISRSCPVGEEYIFINRGHDWIVRCAFELDLPNKWKVWLQLMYEKQPYKILDLPNFSNNEESNTFIGTLHTAAEIGGFTTMIPVIKFWLRQALTIVQVWDISLRVEGNGVALMPTYDWCVAAYQKMWHRFKTEVRNPLSEYPYMVRDGLFYDIRFMPVFEECWKWVALATQGLKLQDFDPYETRMVIYKYVLTLALTEFQPHDPSTQEELEKAFGIDTEDSGYLMLAESPVVHVDNLNNDLRQRPMLYDGLCQNFYPHLPNVTEAEFEESGDQSDESGSMSSESGSEEYEDDDDGQWNEHELALVEDVEVEAVGQRINVGHFTHFKLADEGDFCTICQEEIAMNESYDQRCVVPLTCSHTFHAECLDVWMNSTAKICNHCPHCKTQITKLRRPTRIVDDTDEDMAD